VCKGDKLFPILQHLDKKKLKYFLNNPTQQTPYQSSSQTEDCKSKQSFIFSHHLDEKKY